MLSASLRYCNWWVTRMQALFLRWVLMQCVKRRRPTAVSTAPRGSSRSKTSASTYTALDSNKKVLTLHLPIFLLLSEKNQFNPKQSLIINFNISWFVKINFVLGMIHTTLQASASHSSFPALCIHTFVPEALTLILSNLCACCVSDVRTRNVTPLVLTQNVFLFLSKTHYVWCKLIVNWSILIAAGSDHSLN